MFKFDFDLQDDLDDAGAFDSSECRTEQQEKTSAKSSPASVQPSAEVALDQLLSSLPPVISYSHFQIPVSSGQYVDLARRDLFDARFQLISRSELENSESEEEETSQQDRSTALQFIDAPSDLVPGVYEGGLKTWECSLDLVTYLDEQEVSYRGKRILELGCGTAVPSLYILNRLFSTRTDLTEGQWSVETHIHLQDYNRSVLELITLPNVIMTWYLSRASHSYRGTSSEADAQPNDLTITPELIAAFLASLASMNIVLRFFYGSWELFDISTTGGKYDIVLTSETIYRTDSLGSLVQLLSDAQDRSGLATMTETKLSLSTSQNQNQGLCLVAAKVLYFGVGGGISEFVRAVEDPAIYPSRKEKRRKGKVDTVWEKTGGVGRKVLQVHWE
ncbi:hypothetical protein NEOLEDRAFT_1158769 [Neolentinus lepideus HHB14362 ss-1]|uniref:protein-histidine N-methyltransferase n=1 Tax=Neolentinus lepideus HHB14362 ss-1 TaxID=1314782 RepID=A0A165NW36_9AGAM|nr:hypothetical protein NEOLEDRAFT_1158769 [Neolentinus lepideus HHB14362 ss-1]